MMMKTQSQDWGEQTGVVFNDHDHNHDEHILEDDDDDNGNDDDDDDEDTKSVVGRADRGGAPFLLLSAPVTCLSIDNDNTPSLGEA